MAVKYRYALSNHRHATGLRRRTGRAGSQRVCCYYLIPQA